ncbi:hypothetical protein GQ42DRAFT_171745 [Ramicandelaber brevisporus]|nr:hypothetical protein GQ42DRAFT_171745 [Ramicandelaber brevisporus]
MPRDKGKAAVDATQQQAYAQQQQSSTGAPRAQLPVWLHCNQCFYYPQRSNDIDYNGSNEASSMHQQHQQQQQHRHRPKGFFVTDCGHVLCSSCKPSPPDKSCPICNSANIDIEPVETLDFAAFFNPTSHAIEQLIQIDNFQQSNTTALIHLLMSKNARQKTALKKAKEAINQNQELKRKLDNAERENERLRARLAAMDYRNTGNGAAASASMTDPQQLASRAPTSIMSNEVDVAALAAVNGALSSSGSVYSSPSRHIQQMSINEQQFHQHHQHHHQHQHQQQAESPTLTQTSFAQQLSSGNVDNGQFHAPKRRLFERDSGSPADTTPSRIPITDIPTYFVPPRLTCQSPMTPPPPPPPPPPQLSISMAPINRPPVSPSAFTDILPSTQPQIRTRQLTMQPRQPRQNLFTRYQYQSDDSPFGHPSPFSSPMRGSVPPHVGNSRHFTQNSAASVAGASPLISSAMSMIDQGSSQDWVADTRARLSTQLPSMNRNRIGTIRKPLYDTRARLSTQLPSMNRNPLSAAAGGSGSTGGLWQKIRTRLQLSPYWQPTWFDTTKYRQPAPSELPPYERPLTPASNIHDNYYYKRDVRRNFPASVAYTQTEVARLIAPEAAEALAQPGAAPVIADAALSGQVGGPSQTSATAAAAAATSVATAAATNASAPVPVELTIQAALEAKGASPIYTAENLPPFAPCNPGWRKPNQWRLSDFQEKKEDDVYWPVYLVK